MPGVRSRHHAFKLSSAGSTRRRRGVTDRESRAVLTRQGRPAGLSARGQETSDARRKEGGRAPVLGAEVTSFCGGCVTAGVQRALPLVGEQARHWLAPRPGIVRECESSEKGRGCSDARPSIRPADAGDRMGSSGRRQTGPFQGRVLNVALSSSRLWRGADLGRSCGPSHQGRRRPCSRLISGRLTARLWPLLHPPQCDDHHIGVGEVFCR
jgi:hypothetical protein